MNIQYGEQSTYKKNTHNTHNFLIMDFWTICSIYIFFSKKTIFLHEPQFLAFPKIKPEIFLNFS